MFAALQKQPSRNWKSNSKEVKFGKTTICKSSPRITKNKLFVQSFKVKYKICSLSNLQQKITFKWKITCTNTASNFDGSKLGESSHSAPTYTRVWRIHRDPRSPRCDDGPHRWKPPSSSRVSPLQSKTKFCFDGSLEPPKLVTKNAQDEQNTCPTVSTKLITYCFSQ